jgi:hypothetical protein
MNMTLATALLATLPQAPLPGLFNPWLQHCDHESDNDGPDQRLERLARHLDCIPGQLLIGEAFGYQGGATVGLPSPARGFSASAGSPGQLLTIGYHDVGVPSRSRRQL